jgi:hypothetical protein
VCVHVQLSSLPPAVWQALLRAEAAPVPEDDTQAGAFELMVDCAVKTAISLFSQALPTKKVGWPPGVCGHFQW